METINDTKTIQTTFDYKPLSSTSSIRLLQIREGHRQDYDLALDMVEFKDNTTYRCISYTWGGPRYTDNDESWTSRNHIVVLENKPVYIRRNLHDCLIHLQKLGVYGPLWIDTLCINQSDTEERNSQVAQMGRIYQNAEEVIVWLGNEEDYTSLAIQAMKKLPLTLEEVVKYTMDENQSHPWMEESFAKCDYSDAELVAIIQFFVTCRWFSRIWTVQELVLARNICFVCGVHVTDLQTMTNGGILLSFYGLTSAHSQVHQTEELEWARDFPGTVMAEFVRRMGDDRRLSVGNAAHSFRSRKAMDPKDKVFGVVGISSKCSKLIHLSQWT
jgi:hypothetical protein